MKNKATLTLKLASVLLVVAMLLSVFSVTAADVNGYYKTIASQDFEQVNTDIAKKENVAITTLSNGSTGYLYANPTGIKNISVAPISGLQKDKQYTYMVDLYIIDYSNDAGGCITRLDLANMDGQLVEAYLGKDSYSLNQWYTYSKTVTYNTTLNSWFSIYTFGDARVIYDNVRIVDEEDNVVYIEDFEEEKHTLTEGFSYIHDYSGGSVDANDKVLHLTNSTTGNVNGTIGEFALGEESTTTTYTLTYDYLINRKSTNESIDFVFRYSSYCSECKGDSSFGHKPYGDRDHYIGSGKETGKWYSDTLTINLDDKCDNTYAEIHLFPNAEVIFDNIVVEDSNGNVVKTFDMNSGTVTGGIGRGNFGGDIEFAVKNELIWLKGAPNVTDGHISVDTTDLIADNKAIDIEFNSAQAIAANKYPTVTFDYKMSGTPNTTNGVAVGISFNGITEPSYSRNFFILSDTNGEWVTADAVTFTNLDVREGANTLNLLVYGGIEIEIDNIKLVNSGVTVASIDFANNGTFTEDSEREVIASKGPDASDTVYKMLFDAGELFRTQTTNCKNTISISFDYLLVSGGVELDSAQQMGSYTTMLKGGFNSVVLEASSGTSSFRFDATKAAELYIWNVTILTDGNEATFANRTDRTTCEFSEVSYSDVPTTFVDTAMLVDTTSVADDGDSNKSFWFNELGMSNHNNQLVSGEQYTITFDVYLLQKPTVKADFFHYRTSSGSDSSDAGWWGRDLEVGKWQTTSYTFTVENATNSGNHILFVYGGFEGYVDNLKLVDKNGNEVNKTYTDFSALTVPEKHTAYLTMTSEFPAKPVEAPVVTGDNYDVKYVVDNEGIKTYGSNGVLYINTDEWMGYTFQKGNIGADILAGKKYRLSFDYDVLTPGTNTSEWSIAMVEVKTDKEGDHNDYVTTAVPVSGSKSYEFVAIGNNDVYLAVNAGCEVVIDNIVLEEFVNFPTLGVQKRGSEEDATVSALAYGMQLHTVDGAEYIYDISGNAIEVAEKGFIAVLTSHLHGAITLDTADTNPYVSVVEVTEPAEAVIFAGDTHNVYTLAITDPELEGTITVRPYVLDAEGNAYYGDATDASASDLADRAFNSWIGAAVN